MLPEFTIVTAVTKKYLPLLYWGSGTWLHKPQFQGKPLIVYYDEIKERQLHFLARAFPNITYRHWDTSKYSSKSEAMFSAFVFGACLDVKTPYYMKLDADAYCRDGQDVWVESDFNFSVVGHKWHYTRPASFIGMLDNYYHKTNNPIDTVSKTYKHRRFESYCCLHNTEWVRTIASKLNGKLPVPSHDTTLWYYADKEGSWLGKNIKRVGVDNASNKKRLREIVCSGDIAFNPVLNKDLVKNIQIEITSKCNIGCNQCDRNCGVIPAGDDLTVVQVWKFFEELLLSGKAINRIDIIGGEPTLHPQLKEILALVKIYKDKNPRTKIRLSTNGLGEKVNDVLKSIPSWVHVRNSNKKGKDQPHDAYRIAPIDSGAIGIKACSVPWRCGIALTPHGFFPCGAGASLAKVFGFDIGIKSFAEVTPSRIKEQLLQLCKYCGHSQNAVVKSTGGNEMSDSWKKAVAEFSPDKMSRY